MQDSPVPSVNASPDHPASGFISDSLESPTFQAYLGTDHIGRCWSIRVNGRTAGRVAAHLTDSAAHAVAVFILQQRAVLS